MQYMIRIEIHRANGDMYDRLHVAAAAEGLSRMLTAERTNKKSKMPIGTYWIESTLDAWAILEAAKRAALPIDNTAEIVVAGGPQIVYYNCPDALPEHPLAAMLGVGLTPPPPLASHAFAPPLRMAAPKNYLSSLLDSPIAPPRGGRGL